MSITCNVTGTFTIHGNWAGINSAVDIVVELNGSNSQNATIFERGLRLPFGQLFRKMTADEIKKINEAGKFHTTITRLLAGNTISVEDAEARILDAVEDDYTQAEATLARLQAAIDAAKKAAANASS